jgi:hypothetical protein
MDDLRLGCRDKGLKFGVWDFGRVGERVRVGKLWLGQTDRRCVAWS